MTGDALLRRILEDPADDSARLVYADWLEEQGDADRAEFIRVQCSPCECKYSHHNRSSQCGRCQREQALLDKHVMDWMDETEELGAVGHVTIGLTPPYQHHHGGWICLARGSGGPTIEADFVRGFVGRIQAKSEDFMRHAAEIFAIQPVITEVRLTDCTAGTRYQQGGPFFLIEPFDGDLATSPIYTMAKRVGRRIEGHPSRSAALDALSSLAVAYGRSLAGLPELPLSTIAPPLG